MLLVRAFLPAIADRDRLSFNDDLLGDVVIPVKSDAEAPFQCLRNEFKLIHVRQGTIFLGERARSIPRA